MTKEEEFCKRVTDKTGYDCRLIDSGFLSYQIRKNVGNDIYFSNFTYTGDGDFEDCFNRIVSPAISALEQKISNQ